MPHKMGAPGYTASIMNDSLARQLTPAQTRAVFHLEGPLLVIAGPGSGKTRVITYRIAALIDAGIRPHNICAVTFTNKAADEMRQRTIALGTAPGSHISTFHSLCVTILRRYASKAAIQPNFSIYDDSDQTKCIKQAITDCDLDTTNFPPSRCLEAISTRLKNNLIDVDSFKNQADDFFSVSLAKIYTRYQQILSQANALDFDDLLLKTAFLLRDHPDVCDELANRFKFLLIDEYQDTNYAQYKIAKALVSSHNNICATGDPDQSIYRWRGADIRNILTFENDWPNAAVVMLEENFRSTPDILEIADRLISCNQNRKPKKLVPIKPRGQNVVINAFPDELQEAHAVAQRITELTQQGASLNDMAVFYRTNAQSRALEETFIHSKIPYQIVRGVEFYNRKEIRDILAYLKVLVNPDDEIALLRIINTPPRGIGKTTTDAVRAYAARCNITLFEALGRAGDIDSLSKAPIAKIAAFVNMLEQFKTHLTDPVAVLAEQVFAQSGLKDSLQAAGAEAKDAVENINELINAADIYDRQADEPSLLDYLQQISLFSDVDSYDQTRGCVALMTLHTAKGLEFENVFIVGVEEGLLPHEKSNTDDTDDFEEERRLLFVGITRAKVCLYISYALYRTIRGQLLRTIPSQFLFELGITFAEPSQENDTFSDSDISQYDFSPGDMVHHDSFGLGTVKEFIDMGENSIVVVKFNTGQTKSLMLKYANLSKVNI